MLLKAKIMFKQRVLFSGTNSSKAPAFNPNGGNHEILCVDKHLEPKLTSTYL